MLSEKLDADDDDDEKNLLLLLALITERQHFGRWKHDDDDDDEDSVGNRCNLIMRRYNMILFLFFRSYFFLSLFVMQIKKNCLLVFSSTTTNRPIDLFVVLLPKVDFCCREKNFPKNWIMYRNRENKDSSKNKCSNVVEAGGVSTSQINTEDWYSASTNTPTNGDDGR